MREAPGGADLGAVERPPDHFQRCTARHKGRGEGMAQIVDFCLHAHPLPEPLEANHRLPFGTSAGKRKRLPFGTALPSSRIRITA
ncbi:MAG: hypothetical protein ACEQSU_08245 [Microgenomates group bacterium]